MIKTFMSQQKYYLWDIINIYFFRMLTGKVKFFVESKGFGFITNDETGADIFVHITATGGKELKEGQKVSYNEEDGRKGKVATDVVVIG